MDWFSDPNAWGGDYSDGLNFHFPKGYIYFTMAFSFFVEMLNLRIRKKNKVTKN